MLQITGGSDLSEQFDVNALDHVLQPGMVVSIDPDHPGQLRLSTRAYDPTVAGVVSGAGGVKPGMLMGQVGTAADGKHPVALTGRVYCQVDASYGAIRPGNLLTTSDTPGHAMKVTNHAQAQGAIIGKAMTGLESGKGLVLVLVGLRYGPNTIHSAQQRGTKMKTIIGLTLLCAASLQAQTYASSWSAFNSGRASSQSGGVGHLGVLGSWACHPLQSANYAIEARHLSMPIPESPGQGPSLRISLVGNGVRVSCGRPRPRPSSSSESDPGQWFVGGCCRPYQSDGNERFILYRQRRPADSTACGLPSSATPTSRSPTWWSSATRNVSKSWTWRRQSFPRRQQSPVFWSSLSFSQAQATTNSRRSNSAR